MPNCVIYEQITTRKFRGMNKDTKENQGKRQTSCNIKKVG